MRRRQRGGGARLGQLQCIFSGKRARVFTDFSWHNQRKGTIPQLCVGAATGQSAATNHRSSQPYSLLSSQGNISTKEFFFNEEWFVSPLPAPQWSTGQMNIAQLTVFDANTPAKLQDVRYVIHTITFFAVSCPENSTFSGKIGEISKKF